MTPRFLDTNVLLRYLTRDDEEKARAALTLLLRVERGEERVTVSPLVIFETVFTLQKSYRVPRTKIKELLEGIISMRGVRLADKEIYYRAFELYVAHKNVSFADAFNAAFAVRRGLSEIYSCDTDFERIEGVRRVEPKEDAG